MLKKMLLTAAAGVILAAPVALADQTAPTLCHDGCEIKLTKKTTWVPARYRTVTKRVYISPRYQTVSRRVWIPHRYRTVSRRTYVPTRYTTVTRRHWIPHRYHHRRIAVRDRCGRIIGYRRVRVLVPGTGRHVYRTERVRVPGTGRWVTRSHRELIPGTGIWTVRSERRLVAGTGQWVTRSHQALIPGTGQHVTEIDSQLICHADDFVAAPIQATGSGAKPGDIDSARARLLAIRAARLDASRKLAEQLFGVKITSGTTIKDMVLTSDLIASEVQGLVRGAREISLTENPDGTFSVTLEIDAMALQALVAGIS